MLRVVRGDPDDAEVAALVVALVLVAARAGAAPSDRVRPPPGARWADPARRLGVAAPGPGRWESSTLPR